MVVYGVRTARRLNDDDGWPIGGRCWCWLCLSMNGMCFFVSFRFVHSCHDAHRECRVLQNSLRTTNDSHSLEYSCELSAQTVKQSIRMNFNLTTNRNRRRTAQHSKTHFYILHPALRAQVKRNFVRLSCYSHPYMRLVLALMSQLAAAALVIVFKRWVFPIGDCFRRGSTITKTRRNRRKRAARNAVPKTTKIDRFGSSWTECMTNEISRRHNNNCNRNRAACASGCSFVAFETNAECVISIEQSNDCSWKRKENTKNCVCISLVAETYDCNFPCKSFFAQKTCFDFKFRSLNCNR